VDPWLIVALAAFALVVIALLVLARRRGNAKRRGRVGASRERTRHELHELRAREIDPDR
jgi:hypothetical protein